MPDFCTLMGGAIQAAGANTGATGGTTVNDASTDVKGSWTEMIAATSYDASWLQVTALSLNSTDSFLFDIGVGASTAEKVLIPDLLSKQASSSSPVGRSWILPLFVPAGTRLSARCASSTAGADGMHVVVQAIAGMMASTSGMGRVQGFGSNATGSTGTSIDPGGTANTLGTWTELIASTSNDYHWMTLSISGNALTAGTVWLTDIGIGANPNEKVLVPQLLAWGGTSGDTPVPASWSFPCFVPAGTRLSARCQCSVNTATERLLFICGQGVG